MSARSRAATASSPGAWSSSGAPAVAFPTACGDAVATFDCVAWTTTARRRAAALVANDVVEVQGALRRRFWRAGGGTASRHEVEAASLRRVSARRRT